MTKLLKIIQTELLETTMTQIGWVFYTVNFFGCFGLLGLDYWVYGQPVNWITNLEWSFLFSFFSCFSFIWATMLTGTFAPLNKEPTVTLTLKRIAVMIIVTAVGLSLVNYAFPHRTLRF
jgi:hypothetical protein